MGQANSRYGPDTEYAVLDDFYLGVSLLVSFGTHVFGLALAAALQARARKRNRLPAESDIPLAVVGSATVVLLATMCYGLAATRFPRQTIVLAFALAWAVRLGIYRVQRAMLLGAAADPRLRWVQGRFWRLTAVWTGQWVWLWGVSLPVVLLNSAYVSGLEGGGNVPFGQPTDIAGIVLFALGFALETTSDALKYRWQSGAHRHPHGALINSGPWAWSRHPNYFGEIVLWLGIFLLSITPSITRPTPLYDSSRQMLFLGLIAPLLTLTLVLFGTGLPTVEKPAQRRAFLAARGLNTERQPGELLPYGNQHEADPWLRTKAVRERTSILIPLPPALYRPLPAFLKRTLLLDWPIYRFDDTKHGQEAVARAQEKNEHLAV